jgi:hypothetical protein
MKQGRQREGLMANSLDDPLADAVLAKGEPSFAALAALYPGKVLDRTVLGSYSDPNTPVTGSNEEFIVWWNGAISANLITEQVGNNTRSVAENTNILFRVGPRGEMFGKEGTRFSHLGYEDGYLPIANASYTCDGVRYSETAFADRPAGHNQDTAYVRFEMKNLSSSPRSAELQEQLTLLDSSRVSVSGPRVLDASGKVLLAFAGGETTFDPARQQLTHRVRLAPHSIAHIVLKIPYTPELPEQTRLPTAEEFIAVHARVRGFWNHLLSDGVQIRVPEKRVNDMWRALLLQNFVIADGPPRTDSLPSQWRATALGKMPKPGSII